MRGDRLRLLDIIESIDNVERYVRRGREAFEANELIQTWFIHHIEIIGEAVRHLSEELKQRHREVPWREIAAMRNLLVHEYFRIDLQEVWSAVHDDLPRLKPQIQSILESDPDVSKEAENEPID